MLLLTNLVERIESFRLGVSVDADAFVPAIGELDESLRFPAAIGATVDATLSVGVSPPPST